MNAFMRAASASGSSVGQSVQAAGSARGSPPPGSISATTGCTTMLQLRAMRDGASSVAPARRRRARRPRPWAEVHVGQVEEGVAALDGAHQRLAPSRAREDLALAEAQPAAAHGASNTGLLCAGRSTPPAPGLEQLAGQAPATSSARKCGTSHITGCPVGALGQPMSPSTWISASAGRRLAYQSRPRSSRLRPSQPKCSRTRAGARRRQLGQAQLQVAQRRCAGATRPARAAAAPSPAQRRLHRSGSQCSSHSSASTAPARAHHGIRLGVVAGLRCGAGLVAVVAPQVLRGQRRIRLHRAVDHSGGRRLVASPARAAARPAAAHVHHVARAPPAGARPDQADGGAGLLHQARRQRHGVGRLAEERRPHAHARRAAPGRAAGRRSRRAQRAQHLPHAGQRGRRGGQAGRARAVSSSCAARACAPGGTAP
jgi:hypothetical protein